MATYFLQENEKTVLILKERERKISYCLEGENGGLFLDICGIRGEENSLRKIRLPQRHGSALLVKPGHPAVCTMSFGQSFLQ